MMRARTTIMAGLVAPRKFLDLVALRGGRLCEVDGSTAPLSGEETLLDYLVSYFVC